MPRKDRAKQFAPFDALKGLQDALRLKEYQHERVQKGEIQEEKANEISKVLINLEKGNKVRLTYFEDGHNKQQQGELKLIIEEHAVQINKIKISIDDIMDIEKL